MKCDLMVYSSGERKLTHAGVRKAKKIKPSIQFGVIIDVKLSLLVLLCSRVSLVQDRVYCRPCCKWTVFECFCNNSTN